MGLGLATPLPVLFSVIGHLGADGPGAAGLLARFTTMTYSGILLGPALIGWLAQGIGLTWTLTALIPSWPYNPAWPPPTFRTRGFRQRVDEREPGYRRPRDHKARRPPP